MLWYAISRLPATKRVKLPGGGSRLFLFKTPVNGTNWLVGPYKDMTPLATDLRTNKALRNFVARNRVRLGLRKTDVPPADVERQEGYGPTVRGADYNKDFTTARRRPVAPPVHERNLAFVNRKSDREANVRSFWDTQTPQSHHIVEFNNLETLGVSHERGEAEMDYLQLPAVLLAGEFHQRYFSAILKPAQRWNKERLQSDIAATYRKLYHERSSLFEPLWRISKVILREAGIEGI